MEIIEEAMEIKEAPVEVTEKPTKIVEGKPKNAEEEKVTDEVIPNVVILNKEEDSDSEHGNPEPDEVDEEQDLDDPTRDMNEDEKAAYRLSCIYESNEELEDLSMKINAELASRQKPDEVQ